MRLSERSTMNPLDEPYDPEAILRDPYAHPKHKEIAAINIRVRDHGEQWSKCANCGDPYQITPEWTETTVCSTNYFSEYRAYLMNPDL